MVDKHAIVSTDVAGGSVGSRFLCIILFVNHVNLVLMALDIVWIGESKDFVIGAI